MNKADKIYNSQLAITMLVYMVVVAVSVWFINANPESFWRIPAALTPMIPASYVPFVFMRYLRHIDELQRQIQLEALGFAFAATAILTLAYGFLENVGFPRVNWIFIWPIMGGLWAMGIALARWRYR
ncbi:MAG: hypothetical protein JOZ51_15010 [Chloroflexi bacterium]|nr:hypothetical protein [Chloroflexota bacterium]